ncbi:uncharacterized protein LY89DRAFT_112632 [Mollisia scopiformis]|uniref:F-box domain-containing protein n=1 Tax=Mollisia scopiformis TaxID=149040 RepID=A0A194X5S3_MOLSC|nr:uncharacterized protein LY89DRAFT_112632 [Mollisia scopiformis]KUJ15429.1 hypothetical protein LY89DRAFT_112632 [Mollisia scopiformis]
MASNGSPIHTTSALNLNDLYKQLRDIDSMEERLVEDERSLARGQRPAWGYDDDSEFNEEDTTKHLSRVIGILKKQQETISLLNPMLNELRDTLRENVNIVSRPTIRALTILDLPDELLAHIFDFVKGRITVKHVYMEFGSDDTVKNVRLTCKRFCNASSHLLVHFLRLHIEPGSLSHLKDVSSHTLICKRIEYVHLTLRFYAADMARDIYMFARYHLKHLRELTDDWERFFSSDYEGDLERKALISKAVMHVRNILKSWEMFLDGSPEDLVDSRTDFTARLHDGIANESSGHLLILRKAHGLYKHRFGEQQRLLKKNNFVEAVAAAFSRMPKARRLELHDREDRWKVRNAPHWIEGATNHSVLVHYMVYPMSSEQATLLGLQAPGRMLRMPITLPKAIHKAGSCLTSFSLRLSNPQIFSCLSMSNGDCTNLRVAMRKLTAFEFRPDPFASWAPSAVREEAEMKHLRDYVTAVIDTDTIEDLSLWFDSYWTKGEVPLFEMGALMSSRPWPKLYSLHTDGIPLHLADIKCFVEQLQGDVSAVRNERHLLVNWDLGRSTGHVAYES